MEDPKEMQALNGGILELEALIRLWVKTLIRTSFNGNGGLGGCTYEISYAKMKIKHGKPQFTKVNHPKQPKMRILFKSTYENNSSQEQSNRFSAERSTESKAEMSVYEGLCLPVQGVHVPLPDAVSDANAGFPTELGICKKEQKTMNETLKWSVHTQIPVSPGEEVTAKMIVEEKEWSGEFTIKTTLSGKVKVTVHTAAGDLLQVQTGDIVQICNQAKQKGLDVANLAITNGKNPTVSFTTSGNLLFRYGVHQRVQIDNAQNEDYDDSYDDY